MNTPSAYELLKLDLEVALDLAACGRVKDGYHVLDGGLAAIEAPPHESWSDDLAQRYRQALVLYAQAHGLWFALPPDADEITPPSRTELNERQLQQVQATRNAVAASRVTASETRRRAACIREENRRTREELAAARSQSTAGRLRGLMER